MIKQILTEDYNNKKNRDSGIAILIAIFTVSMMVLFSVSLINNSAINLSISQRYLDNLKAEYLAKSATNLGVFLLSTDLGVDLFMMSDQSPLKQDAIDSPYDIWAMLNGIPLGGATGDILNQMQDMFELESINNEDILNVFKLFDGEFVLNIEDEGGKINVNDCSEGRCIEVQLMLEALFSCPAEKFFMENLHIHPKELIARIKDWVDKDTIAEPESGFNDEDSPYYDINYKSKNAPFDTVEELKMIPGWTPVVHMVFSPYITVYPFKKITTAKSKININTASRALLGCLIPEAKINCSKDFEINYKTMSESKLPVASKNSQIKEVISQMFCASSDTQNKDKWFTVRSSTFNIRSKGIVGVQTVDLNVVIERVIPDKNNQTSYKLLFWKLL